MKKNNVFEDKKPFQALIVALIAIIAGYISSCQIPKKSNDTK